MTEQAEALYAATSVAAPEALEKSDRKNPNRNSALKLKEISLQTIRVPPWRISFTVKIYGKMFAIGYQAMRCVAW